MNKVKKNMTKFLLADQMRFFHLFSSISIHSWWYYFDLAIDYTSDDFRTAGQYHWDVAVHSGYNSDFLSRWRKQCWLQSKRSKRDFTFACYDSVVKINDSYIRYIDFVWRKTKRLFILCVFPFHIGKTFSYFYFFLLRLKIYFHR